MDYRELLLLRAARETGVIDAITTTAGTAEGVAAETGVTERAARVTLEVLADRGFLERVGGEYEVTNRALGFLSKTDVRSIGPIPHQLDCIERAIDLPETMRTGALPERPDDWTPNILGALAGTDVATVRACVTAAIHERPDAARVLDVGGGPGTFATEFARRGFDATLVDRPEVVEIDGPLLEHESVDLVAGDVLDSLPSGFDLVFCSRVAHVFGPAENRRLLRNVHDALEPGGAAVLIDYVRGRSDFAPTMAAHMLAQTENGGTYTADQFTEWLADAGFEGPRVEDVPGTDVQAIVAGRAID